MREATLAELASIALHLRVSLPAYVLVQGGNGLTRDGKVLELVPPSHPHLARGSYVVDGAFTELFLAHLEALFHDKLARHVQTSVASSQQEGHSGQCPQRRRRESRWRALEQEQEGV